MRIIIFIESLSGGGKERRLIELLGYLKNLSTYNLLIVLTKPEIHYEKFFRLNINYEVIERKGTKKDPRLFYQFYQICSRFKPQIIQTWGNMVSFYAIPSSVFLKIPIINCQITNAPNKIKWLSFFGIICKINFYFSRLVVSNSKAGIAIYKVNPLKARVINNGVDPSRFNCLPPVKDVRENFGILTPYAVIMTASFTENKDYSKFVRIAMTVTSSRADITFIGAGDGANDDRIFKNICAEAKGNALIIFPGRVANVEELVNACDIGVLFSPNGEGISNSILEYMSMGKPVIANDAGGTKEIINHGVNGYLVTDESVEQISRMIIELIDNEAKRNEMGKIGKQLINDLFSLNKMGNSFEKLYEEIIT